MVYLEVKNISKKFGEVTVLRNISFEVNQGEIFAIAGPPGAGKTTLLKILAGLITPDEGIIYLEGRNITGIPPSERNIGMVFEMPPVYPDRTGFENIAFPLRLQKLPKDHIEKRVYEIAELLGIKHLLNRPPTTYSGGEYQRVALARALVRNPSILLLDEPLRNLDAKVQESMRSWLKRLQRELKTTVIYSTHDPLDAMAIGDRVSILIGGSVKQLGSPTEVYSSPVSLEVAEYTSIPALNILKGKMREVDQNLVEIDINGILKIRKKLIKPIIEEFREKEIIIGIRPREIDISEVGPSENTITGRLVLVQTIGSENLITVEVDKYLIRALSKKKLTLTEGSNIFLTLNPDRIYLFDPETGAALYF
jgi:ABC-type sugar transport system ATPase subunit